MAHRAFVICMNWYLRCLEVDITLSKSTCRQHNTKSCQILPLHGTLHISLSGWQALRLIWRRRRPWPRLTRCICGVWRQASGWHMPLLVGIVVLGTPARALVTTQHTELIIDRFKGRMPWRRQWRITHDAQKLCPHIFSGVIVPSGTAGAVADAAIAGGHGNITAATTEGRCCWLECGSNSVRIQLHAKSTYGRCQR